MSNMGKKGRGVQKENENLTSFKRTEELVLNEESSNFPIVQWKAY